MVIKIIYLACVFLSGFVVSINVTKIMYGIPEHYEGGYGKIAFALFLATMCSIVVLLEKE